MSIATGDKGTGKEARNNALAYARSIIDTVREPLVVLDGRLRVQSANRSFYRTFRVSPQETEGRLLYDLGNGQWDIPRLRTLLDEILPQSTSFDDIEVEHDFPDIGRKVMLLNARKLRQAGTELILLAIEDVTERRRAEAERQAIETRFTSLVKNVKDHSNFSLDPEGRVTSWNVAAEHILAYSEAEVLGQHFAFIFTPEDREQGLPEGELRAARERGRAEDERWHLRKGGERFWAFGILSALHDADGRLTGFSKILRDMTAWKGAEQALREREDRLRLVQRATRDTIWDWDIENDRQRWSEAGAEAFGWTDAVEAPQTAGWWTDRVYGEDRERVAEGFRHALDDPACERWQDEYRFLRRDGSVAYVLDRGIIVRDASGKPRRMIGAMQDITERKRAEEALRQSEAKYRSLFESIDEGFCIIEMIFDERDKPVDYRFLEVNPAFERHTGLVNARGKSVRELLPAHEEHWFEFYGRIALAGEAMRFQNHAAQLHRWYDVYAWRYGEPQDRQVAVLFNDVTLRKQAEEALQEANRRKDAFLATLAHELRNPLAPIRTGLDLIQALPGDAAACAEPLRIMDRQVTHLVRLVDDLLDVSRISRGKIELRKERLDLVEILDAALEISGTVVGMGNRHLTVSVPSQPLTVEGDPVRLVQVVSNLLNNAAKFTDEGGHIELRVVPQGDRVEIRVQDDGRGIPRDRITEVFEPFVQTEPRRGNGLGIGLALVRSLVTMHGGTVSAESGGPGQGATFTVSLPLSPGLPVQPSRSDATDTEPAPRRRVLVVDDNRDIAEGLRLLLTMLKVEVRVAHDGAEAIQICEDWSPTHVLMDLGMPGMDGYEAARRLRAEHAGHDLRLIAVTGWGQDEDRQRSREAGFDEHLVKPVGVAELKSVLSS